MFNKCEHDPNADIPRFVTLLGTITLTRLEQLINALDPMLVTGIPFIVSGKVTALEKPKYLPIVEVLLLVE